MARYEATGDAVVCVCGRVWAADDFRWPATAALADDDTATAPRAPHVGLGHLLADLDVVAAWERERSARIGALRAEGRLPAAAPAPAVPERPTAEAWRAELRAAVAAHARPADPPAVVRWRCACGAEVESYGAPAEPRECGPCEIKRQSVTDMSRLGGRR